MRYLIILLMLLIGCTEEKDMFDEEPNVRLNTIEEGEAYIGRCFTRHKSMYPGTYQIKAMTKEDNVNKSMREQNLAIYYYTKLCDYKKKSKCIVFESIEGWVAKEYIIWHLDQDYKEVSCKEIDL